MTDHQRADTVLPEHPAITPNLDRLASEGLTFTNVYCPSPHCCPSRATFHTGLYPSRHGVWNNVCIDQALTRGLKDGVRCWSEGLAEAGYNLAFTGKWHVSTLTSPGDHGWRELSFSGNQPREHHTAWEAYENIAGEPEPAERGEGQILRPGYGTYTLYGSYDHPPAGADERSIAEGEAALPELAAGDAPWCLFVGLGGPHDPYRVPRRFLDLYRLEDVPLPAAYEDTFADKPQVYKRMRDMRFGQLSEREVREAVRHFWAYCTYLDELFGRLLAALEATGQADDTLVLYCSDHGDYCGEHGLFAKGIPCFNGAYHVPGTIRWPAGGADPGSRVDELVSLADFAPTFTELAGAEPKQTFTGRSLVLFLRGEAPDDWRDEIHTQCNGVELYYTQRSVRTRTHKYVFNGFDVDELYDLAKDPNELVNVADDPAYAAVKRDLVRPMWGFARREEDGAVNGYITVSLAPYGPAEALRPD
jgi:arylsulfatase A-like enzyme